jgi:F-type H+-transporting ATPase subunit delta
MSDILVAKRYAQALHGAARELDVLEAVDADVELIRSSLEASRELVLFFESPIVSRERKSRVVKALFESRLSETTLNFLELLVQKRREDIFPQIVVAYRQLRDRQLGIVGVTLRTAQPIDDDETSRIARALESWTGGKISIEAWHDPLLIGGLLVRIGDTVYDGSVRNKLEHLREQFAAGSFRNN